MSTVSPITSQIRAYLIIENLFTLPKTRNYIFMYSIKQTDSPYLNPFPVKAVHLCWHYI